MRATILTAVLAGVLLVTSALAASTAKDPKNLILQRSDLPSGARKLPFSISKSGTLTVPKVGKVRHAEALYRAGTRFIGTVAFVFASSSAARQAFTRTAGKSSGTFKTLHVAKLGDQQIARGVFSRGVSSVIIAVRDDEVVWETAVSFVPGLSQAKSTAQTMALARKQNARVDRS
jgi:hypothetical protein